MEFLPNPCPCTSLQTGCRIMAMFEVVSNFLVIGAIIVYLTLFFNTPPSRKSKDVSIGANILTLVICVIRIALGLQLYEGAVKVSLIRNRWKVKLWLLTAFITGTVYAISYIGYAIAVSFVWASLPEFLATSAYNVYNILVSFLFYRELVRDPPDVERQNQPLISKSNGESSRRKYTPIYPQLINKEKIVQTSCSHCSRK